MKVRDLITDEIDIDVYDDYTEELCIAFVGPLRLTNNGESKFAEVLNYDITIKGGNCIVHCDNDHQLKKACEFFNAAAGWCSEDDYDKWFELNE
jgi:hypothetical protein